MLSHKDNMQLIIGAGEPIGKVAEAYGKRQPISDNEQEMVRFFQEAINQGLSPKQAAAAFKLGVPLPEMQPSADMAPQGGLMNSKPQEMPGTQSRSASFGLSTGLTAPKVDMPKLEIQPQAQARPQAQAQTQRPQLKLDPSKMTREEYDRNIDRLRDTATMTNRSTSRLGYDPFELERLKQGGRKDLATFNAGEKLRQIRTTQREMNKRHLAQLSQRGEQFDREMGYKYYALGETLERMDERIKVARTGSDIRARVDAYEALAEDVQELRDNATEIRTSLDWDDEEQVKAYQSLLNEAEAIEKEVKKLRPEMEKIIKNGRVDSTSSVEIEKGGDKDKKPGKKSAPKKNPLTESFKVEPDEE
jgi:hypothetical protein